VSDFLLDAFGDAGGVGNAAHDGAPAIVMAIHTFGEYLDFHPHLHALVADGLFDREGRFHVMRTGELTGELTQEQRGTTDACFAGNHAAHSRSRANVQQQQSRGVAREQAQLWKSSSISRRSRLLVQTAIECAEAAMTHAI
jgi:hypothetical protein